MPAQLRRLDLAAFFCFLIESARWSRVDEVAGELLRDLASR